MFESVNLYLVLGLVEFVIMTICWVLLFYRSTEKWNLTTRVIAYSIVLAINAVQLPMKITSGQPYGLTLAILIIGILAIIGLILLLKENIKK